VVVDVAGKVRHPGLYRLTVGSRVDDALTAAGGPLAGVNLSSLNLAAKVVDGQQIAVGLAGAGGGVGGAGGAPPDGGGSAGGGGPAGGGGAAGAPVNLNTASLDQLETLPGVGPVLGQHILDWRTAHGSFTTIDQLRDVTGIGDVKFANLRPQVTI
jgi:competence protein ComEA